MILPAKHLKQERAFLGIGGDILSVLEQGRSVSELWERVQQHRSNLAYPLSFDWFIFALSFLYAIDAIRYERGIILRRRDDDSQYQ